MIPGDAMIPGGEIRKAREGLGWSLRRLAREAAVSTTTVMRAETEGPGLRVTNAAIRAALEGAGIQFTNAGHSRRRPADRTLDVYGAGVARQRATAP